MIVYSSLFIASESQAGKPRHMGRKGLLVAEMEAAGMPTPGGPPGVACVIWEHQMSSL